VMARADMPALHLLFRELSQVMRINPHVSSMRQEKI
jgi:hypothetical protein